jgi:hypothetical protein
LYVGICLFFLFVTLFLFLFCLFFFTSIFTFSIFSYSTFLVSYFLFVSSFGTLSTYIHTLNTFFWIDKLRAFLLKSLPHSSLLP